MIGVHLASYLAGWVGCLVPNLSVKAKWMLVRPVCLHWEQRYPRMEMEGTLIKVLGPGKAGGKGQASFWPLEVTQKYPPC